MIPYTSNQSIVKSLRHAWPVMLSCLLLWILLLGQGSILAASMEQGVAENDDAEISLEDEGIKGIIVDNTVTIIGRRFYDTFSIVWPDYEVGIEENFSIHEQPTARSGSRIWIEHNNQKLHEVFLSPVLANIQASVRTAAKRVSDRFETLRLEKALFNNPDLAADEI